MTVALSSSEVAQQMTERFPDALIEASDTAIMIDSHSLLLAVAFLKETDGLDFDYLCSITVVVFYDYFEVIY